MRTSLFAVALGAALVSASGCSFLLSYDPEGQPCDSSGECLAGFVCVNDQCVRAPDGGVDGCACRAGEFCSPSTRKCLPNTCEYRRCGVGQSCDDDGGTPTCRDIVQPNLGSICSNDSQCGDPKRVCYRGAVQMNSNGGDLRTGACVETCSGPGQPCQTPGAQCRTFSLGADGGQVFLCVPDAVFTPCINDDACRDHGLVCTVFDHPAIGPATFCDTPLPSGAAIGQACVVNTIEAGGGKLCANGLCVPRQPIAGQQSVCGELCDLVDGVSTCPPPHVCTLVEFAVDPRAASPVFRMVPMCVPQETRCRVCTTNPAACGPDGPRCTRIDQLRCLPACTPDAGTTPACPPGYACTGLDAGYRCVPESVATCP